MIILGIDTSLRSTGYGVLSVEGSRLRALEAGRIRNAPKLPLSACLRAIHARVAELIAQYQPDVLAIESVIYGKNAGTMLVLGEARGAVITAAADALLPVYEYEPRRVKMAVCGNGLAEKIQIQRMVKTLLGLEELPQNDAADALALSRRLTGNINRNIFWALAYNIVAIPLAAGAFYPLFQWTPTPAFSAACMCGSSLCVVLSALRMRGKEHYAGEALPKAISDEGY